MIKRLADNNNNNSIAYGLRRRRAAFFENLLSYLDEPIEILDVGGTEAYWLMTGLADNPKIRVVLLNLGEIKVSLPNFTSMAGDARNLKFGDNSFDVVFSNSVIEHVGGYDDQFKMANEVQRVGKRYFIQTPNKYFPVEPHFLFPAFQFLPRVTRIWLLRNFRLGWFSKTHDKARAADIVDSIRLLGRNEFISMFQGAMVYEEKILGMTKSFIVYGGWD